VSGVCYGTPRPFHIHPVVRTTARKRLRTRMGHPAGVRGSRGVTHRSRAKTPPGAATPSA
jgi:hypothetical protein